MGTTEDTFADLAGADGIRFSRGVSVAWLTNRGHLEVDFADQLERDRAAAIAKIYGALGGDEQLLAGKRRGSDPRLDLVIHGEALAVEIDEIQHFTSDRLVALDLYPRDAAVGFDIEHYRTLIERWRYAGDRYRASKSCTDFPFAGGRRAQRAYFDAFRDLVGPVFGLRILRIPAPECDGRLAYQRFKAAADYGYPSA
jgi:hypothetical protein